jgi:hypothetical protein
MLSLGCAPPGARSCYIAKLGRDWRNAWSGAIRVLFFQIDAAGMGGRGLDAPSYPIWISFGPEGNVRHPEAPEASKYEEAQRAFLS